MIIVEVISGESFEGEWVNESGTQVKDIEGKIYLNHHELQDEGVFLKTKDGCIHHFKKYDILVVRKPYRRET